MCRSIPGQRNGTGSTASKFNLIVVHVFDELGDRAGHEGFENLKSGNSYYKFRNLCKFFTRARCALKHNYRWR